MVEPERPSLDIPRALSERALALATGSDGWTAPEARDAATVILLRDGPAGIEVFLQRRVGKMAFAPGMYVFPGGRVEESDAHTAWRGPTDEPFGIPDGAGVTATFRALTSAGARETWEEAGTVLAVDDSGAPVAGPDQSDADFGSWLAEHGCQIDGAHFRAWSHWITPEVERRRFDTRFLVSLLPDGQSAVDLGVESDHSSWFTPQAALAGVRDGTMPMLPPTSAALTQLAEFDSAAAAWEAATYREPRPWLPRPFLVDGEITWRIVDGYTGDPIEIP
ncbi:MAG: hypothetical protein U0R64_00885 [Candidatus Nanopelagicales bacterium]